MDTSDAIALMRQIPLFAVLRPPALERLAALVTLRYAEKSDCLFRQGEPFRELFLLAQGRVKTVIVAADGSEQIMAVLQPGEIFPHVGWFDGQEYPATAIALDPVVCGVVQRSALAGLLREHAELSAALLDVLLRRVQELQHRIRQGSRDVRGRLASVLIDLAGPDAAPIALTQTDLAHLAATSRESASRALNEWRRAGLIEMERGVITVRDARALAALCE